MSCNETIVESAACSEGKPSLLRKLSSGVERLNKPWEEDTQDIASSPEKTKSDSVSTNHF